ncbi:MAG: tetratricopeptide repeat protein, partial [Bacteroidota bacterium]
MRFLLCCLLLTPFVLLGQCPDTTIARRVDSLITASRGHTGEGEFSEALATSARAAELALANCGEHSAAYGSATFNEGRVRYFMDDNQAAIPWYQKSLEIRGEVLGTDHPDYGKSLNNLAIVYDVLGRYETAEPLYKAALDIREKTAGRESATFANALANLGSLYQQMGKYEAAEALSLEAKDIRGRLLGRDDPAYSASLNNLGNLYLDLRNSERALTYYEEAVAILERLGDTTGVEYILHLDNLGNLHWSVGNYSQANDLLNQALDATELLLGRDNIYYHQVRYHLGLLTRSTGAPDESAAHFAAALRTLAKLQLENTDEFALTLLENARSVEALGDSSQALRFIRQAHEIAGKTIHSGRSAYTSFLRHFVRMEWRYGNRRTALDLCEKAVAQSRSAINRATRHLGDAELSPYLSYFSWLLGATATLADSAPAAAPLL